MNVFKGIKINSLEIENRFVRSATWEGLATPEGAVTRELNDFIKPLACGGTGLLISSHAYVQRRGQAGPRQLGIYDDSLIPGLAGLCRTVHANGGLILAQLTHAGIHAASSLTGLEPLGPTGMENSRGKQARAMTTDEIEELARDFASAARRAVDAGFDGIQIHAGHGYCISQFLSPYYNQRDDEYGGDVKRRARLLLDIYGAVRKETGDSYPICAKVNAEDFIEGGLTVEMMLETAVMMESAGFDAMEMSGGGTGASKYLSSRTFDPQTPEEEAYYREAAKLYKASVKRMPLMLVGGIRSLETAEEIISGGIADMISLSRPLICEPGLVNRWKSGDGTRAKCISCDGCRKPASEGKGLYCVAAGRRSPRG